MFGQVKSHLGKVKSDNSTSIGSFYTDNNLFYELNTTHNIELFNVPFTIGYIGFYNQNYGLLNGDYFINFDYSGYHSFIDDKYKKFVDDSIKNSKAALYSKLPDDTLKLNDSLKIGEHAAKLKRIRNSQRKFERPAFSFKDKMPEIGVDSLTLVRDSILNFAKQISKDSLKLMNLSKEEKFKFLKQRGLLTKREIAFNGIKELEIGRFEFDEGCNGVNALATGFHSAYLINGRYYMEGGIGKITDQSYFVNGGMPYNLDFGAALNGPSRSLNFWKAGIGDVDGSHLYFGSVNYSYNQLLSNKINGDGRIYVADYRLDLGQFVLEGDYNLHNEVPLSKPEESDKDLMNRSAWSLKCDYSLSETHTRISLVTKQAGGNYFIPSNTQLLQNRLQYGLRINQSISSKLQLLLSANYADYDADQSSLVRPVMKSGLASLSYRFLKTNTIIIQTAPTRVDYYQTEGNEVVLKSLLNSVILNNEFKVCKTRFILLQAFNRYEQKGTGSIANTYSIDKSFSEDLTCFITPTVTGGISYKYQDRRVSDNLSQNVMYGISAGYVKKVFGCNMILNYYDYTTTNLLNASMKLQYSPVSWCRILLCGNSIIRSSPTIEISNTTSRYELTVQITY